VLEHPERLPRAEVVSECRAPRSGVVEAIAPRALGRAVVELGGGRRAVGDPIHPGVGFVLAVAPGDRVGEGDLLGEVHARNAEEAERGRGALASAVVLGDRPPPTLRALVSHRVARAGVERL
jgi:thymidine phosphorylase